MTGKLSLLLGPRAGSTPAKPTNIGAPVVSGTAQVGQTLALDNGSWTGSPYGYARKWQVSENGSSGWTDILDETGSTYVLTEDAEAIYIRGVVSATNAAGTSSFEPSAPVGPVAASGDNDTAIVSAKWLASASGAGGAGFDGDEPDVLANVAERLAVSKPMPSINFLGYPSQVFTDTHVYLPFQIKLIDSRVGSPTHGRPVPCKLRWRVEGSVGVISNDSQKIWIDPLGRTQELTCRWLKVMRPDVHQYAVPNSRGAEIRVYAEAIPDDLVNYSTRVIGPISVFPRDPSAVIVKKIAKSAGAGVDYTQIVQAINQAPTEFLQTGKAIVGEVIDTEKAWSTGFRAPNNTVPWLTKITVGLDKVTGLPATAQLGDKANFPSLGISGQGLNRMWFDGFHHDAGATGGIGPRDYGAGVVSVIVFSNCDHFNSGPPASATIGATPYPDYGSGTGQSSLIRGRQPGPAIFTAGTYAEYPNEYYSWCCDYHDLPGTALNRFTAIVNATITNISGSPVQDTYGGVYGLRVSRFGGYYSGLATRPGDSNFAMKLEVTGSDYWQVDRPLVVGANGNSLRFYKGADAASATLVETISAGQYVTVAAVVAAINANVTTLANVTATDLVSAVKLDASFLQVEGEATTKPLAKTHIPAAGGLSMIVTMDIHASGFAFTVGAGQYRMNISVVNCKWFGYCGAASTSGSTADDVTNPNEITYYDINYANDGWYDDRGYVDRKGNWQDMGVELGYLSGSKSGFGMFACTFASAPGTVSSGVAFGAAPFRKMEHAVLGYCYGQFGGYPTGMTMIGIVSPYQSLPSGPTPPINSKFIGVTGTTKPANDVFTDAANADFTLLPTTFARTPDSASWAGIYDGSNQMQAA